MQCNLDFDIKFLGQQSILSVQFDYYPEQHLPKEDSYTIEVVELDGIDITKLYDENQELANEIHELIRKSGE